MKKNNLIFILIFLVVAVSCKKEALSEKLLQSEINKTLNNWHQAAANADFNKYFSYMSEDAVFIGTDASENWNFADFKTFCKPYFDNKKAWHFTPIQRNIFIDKNTAWFNELLKTHMGICRGSGILKKQDNTWKIKQYVLSITIPNNKVNSVVKLNRKHDSIFIQNSKNNNK